MGEIAKPESTALALQPEAVQGLVELWLASQIASTRRVYSVAIRDFARSVGADTTAAVELLLQAHGAANALALAYRAAMQERGLANATVNVRLAALRSFVEHARRMGVIGWVLDVDSVPSEAYRDTRGPGRVGVQRMIVAAQATKSAARDIAILRCLYDLALRRAEVTGLDLADVDLAGGKLHVAGKGSGGEKKPITMSPQLREVMEIWLAVRGADPGPLWHNMDNARKGSGYTRLSTDGVARVVARLGFAVGLRVRPHGLRHSGITDALDLSGGNMRAVRRFSRHKDPRTLEKYDDNREDMAGQIAALVGAASAVK